MFAFLVLMLTVSISAFPVPASASAPLWRPDGDGGFVSDGGTVLSGENLYGVDISEHDGKVDWEYLVESGVDFAILRCAFGYDSHDVSQYNDTMFDRNASECERLGIPYGVYLYSYAIDTEYGPYQEALHVLRQIGDHTPNLGVWYDIEDTVHQQPSIGTGRDAYSALVDTFAKTIRENSDYEVGVYASLSWLRNCLGDVSESGEYPIWMAHWAEAPSTDRDFDYVIWQAGGLKLPGMRRVMDFNVVFDTGWFEEFLGREGKIVPEVVTVPDEPAQWSAPVEMFADSGSETGLAPSADDVLDGPEVDIVDVDTGYGSYAVMMSEQYKSSFGNPLAVLYRLSPGAV